jgi:hypothetical protein
MIGLETMQIAQTVFFVRYLLQDNGPMAVYNICSLSFINGYNPFSSYNNVRNLDGVTMRLGLGKHFLFNVILQTGLIILAWLGYLFFVCKVRQLRRLGADMTPIGMDEIKEVQSNGRKFFTCAFILVTYSFFLFVFALFTSLQSAD